MPRLSIDPLGAAIGAIIREVREAAGLSQADVALRIGCKQVTVSDWEAGRRVMPVTRLPALASALGASVGVLSRRFAAAINDADAVKKLPETGKKIRGTG